VAMGADGLLVEVHPNPAEALSDGQQQVDFASFKKLAEAILPFLSAAKRRQLTTEDTGNTEKWQF